MFFICDEFYMWHVATDHYLKKGKVGIRKHVVSVLAEVAKTQGVSVAWIQTAEALVMNKTDSSLGFIKACAMAETLRERHPKTPNGFCDCKSHESITKGREYKSAVRRLPPRCAATETMTFLKKNKNPTLCWEHQERLDDASLPLRKKLYDIRPCPEVIATGFLMQTCSLDLDDELAFSELETKRFTETSDHLISSEMKSPSKATVILKSKNPLMDIVGDSVCEMTPVKTKPPKKLKPPIIIHFEENEGDGDDESFAYFNKVEVEDFLHN